MDVEISSKSIPTVPTYLQFLKRTSSSNSKTLKIFIVILLQLLTLQYVGIFFGGICGIRIDKVISNL